MRRIIKTPSNESITDNLLIDYINRFYTVDVSSKMNLFDLKTKYQFLTTPGVDKYNMPLYDIQIEPGGQDISFYPVYQGFEGPCFVNGISTGFFTQRSQFDNIYPNYFQTGIIAGYGNGAGGPYTLSVPAISNLQTLQNLPTGACLLRGHVDITGIINTGNNIDPPIGPVDGSSISTIPTTSVNSAVYFSSTGSDGENIVIADSGQFLQSNRNCGLLMNVGKAPYGNTPLTVGSPLPLYSETQNTINYFTGIAQNVYFSSSIPAGMPIYANCYYYQLGIPRSILYFNNTITVRPPSNIQYVVDLTAYLSPAAFLTSTQAVNFGYMTEYLARGAARKLLSDIGDWTQFNQYEPLFLEQERIVWVRSQRQFTSTRVQTIYSSGISYGNVGTGIGLQ